MDNSCRCRECRRVRAAARAARRGTPYFDQPDTPRPVVTYQPPTEPTSREQSAALGAELRARYLADQENQHA